MANNCTVCKTNIGKYKCPKCFLIYCSVKCCNKHKKGQCVPLPPKPPVEDPNTETCKFPTADTVPMEVLQRLDKDKDLKITLENPHVRQIIENLDKSADPEKLLEKAMLEPIFVEFVEQCLKVVDPYDDD